MQRTAWIRVPHSEGQKASDQRLRQVLLATALPKCAKPRLRLCGHALRRRCLRPHHGLYKVYGLQDSPLCFLL